MELYTKSDELDVAFLLPIASQPYSNTRTQKLPILLMKELKGAYHV